MTNLDKTYDFLREKLVEYGLSGLHGSPYDNSFSVFSNDRNDINLITVGTNGNTTDAKHTNAAWLEERYKNPGYSNLLHGNWANGNNPESPLRRSLIDLPSLLNTAFESETKFSKERMLCTNAILVASAGVATISETAREQISKQLTPLNNVRSIINSSLDFLFNGTLEYCCPDIIFSYGNAITGYSAWKLIRNRSKEVLSEADINENGNTYRFARIKTSDSHACILIGWPHPSWRRYNIREDVISEGIRRLNT